MLRDLSRDEYACVMQHARSVLCVVSLARTCRQAWLAACTCTHADLPEPRLLFRLACILDAACCLARAARFTRPVPSFVELSRAGQFARLCGQFLSDADCAELRLFGTTQRDARQRRLSPLHTVLVYPCGGGAAPAPSDTAVRSRFLVKCANGRCEVLRTEMDGLVDVYVALREAEHAPLRLMRFAQSDTAAAFGAYAERRLSVCSGDKTPDGTKCCNGVICVSWRMKAGRPRSSFTKSAE